MTVEYLDAVIYENGMTINCVRVKSKFSESQDRINNFIDEGLLFITAQYGLRRDVSEKEKGKRKSITDLLLDWGDNQDSDSEQNFLFGAKLFDYTKPCKLLYNLIKCNFTNDSIILDFFSGSSTTAHAVMQLNAEDQGNRKFIMVQLPELTDEKSEAYKAGYKNICEIGKERIRRAGKKIAEENATTVPDLDIGFRVLKLDSSSLNDTSATVSETDQKFANFDRIKSDRSSEDLLFQMLLETHIPLSDKIERKTVCGNEVFFVSDTALLACLDAKAKMTTEFFIEIAKLKPGIAFFRDDAFADDSARTNLQQAFDQFSPSTAIKVI